MRAKEASFVLSMAMAIGVATPGHSMAAGIHPVLDGQSQSVPKGFLDLRPWVERDAARRASIKARARELGLEKIAGMARLPKAKIVLIDQVLLPMSRPAKSQMAPKELTEVLRQKEALVTELRDINDMLDSLIEDAEAKSLGIKEV